MAEVFSKPPDKKLFNDAGLCKWLDNYKMLTRKEIKQILGEKYREQSIWRLH